MSSNLLGTSLVISVLWGVQPIMCKNLLEVMSHTSVMLITGIINIICVVIYAIYHQDDIKTDKLTKNNFLTLLFIAVFTTFLTSVMYYNILKDNKSSIVTTLTYTAPIFTLLAGYITLEEQVNIKDIFGVLLVVIGIVTLTYGNNH
jgi:drug/metabolite transporter (DMT)-like permease